MAVVEIERHDSILVVRMNRPEKRNAMNTEMLTELGKAFTEFRDDGDLSTAILTGNGEAFCSGEDLVEAAERGTPGFDPELPYDPFWNDGMGPGETIRKPIIAAVNGWAMGGGFIQAWMSDFRVAARSAVFEISEARHWLLGAYQYGFTDTLPWAIASELALGFRMSAERAYQVGFVNRLADDDKLLDVAFEMCDHLKAIPPASVANTLTMARALRPRIPTGARLLGEKLKENGNLDDVMEARRAFAAKRKPEFTAL
ncbi:enoyl-CoA hydratase/isomerase family protein [Cumulibacter soli]|uniref:enoyl-CoA hydratase/isomerase family protein n=1 Tax=Cumulibacter soli TaxID=2546344 RepID=UPI0010680C2E|nr:enoyl-CoA hydratase/isomerase family protein [Cumulibacter soli]